MMLQGYSELFEKSPIMRSQMEGFASFIASSNAAMNMSGPSFVTLSLCISARISPVTTY